jgi:SsrA-binding protein
MTKGVTIIPLKMYLKHGFAKVLIGVAHGKREYDKRQDIKKREQQRQIDRVMKHY